MAVTGRQPAASRQIADRGRRMKFEFEFGDWEVQSPERGFEVWKMKVPSGVAG